MKIEDTINQAVLSLKTHFGDFIPQVVAIAGSGLGNMVNLLENAHPPLSYAQVEGFPQPGVHGHKGQVVAGTISGVNVAVLQGRVHLYEGDESWRLKVMIRAMRQWGCEILFVTNAAGSLHAEIGPGEIVMINDHINFMGTNPLVGPNDDSFGPRFVDLEDCWDPQLRLWLREAANEAEVKLHEGTYAAWMGPCFETPAEIRMLSRLGADTVGMSTVPDNIIARHCGLRVVGVSVMTNLGCGLSPVKLSHDLTLAEAEKGARKLLQLMPGFFRRLKASAL